mgnify:CR=1 FL=1
MASDFFEKVHTVARLIPEGRVTSYGAIARFLGTGKSARIVGYAMNNSPEDIPAHRVVNRNGLLTGKHHFAGTNLMAELLIEEGVPVKENQIQHFEDYFWDPMKHLNPHDFLI